MIDQYWLQQSSWSIYPSIRQKGGWNIPNTSPSCPFFFPFIQTSGKVQVVPLLHRGNLDVNVKIINKIYFGVVLSVGVQHGNILLALLTVLWWMQRVFLAHCSVSWNVSSEQTEWSKEILFRLWKYMTKYCNMNNKRGWELFIISMYSVGIFWITKILEAWISTHIRWFIQPIPYSHKNAYLISD